MTRTERISRTGPRAGWLRRFARREDGNSTTEFSVWVGILFFFMSYSTNMTMVFFHEAQILRVVQDVSRDWALGRFADALAVETAIRDELAYLDADLTINAVAGGGYTSATVTFEASDLMPLNWATYPFNQIIMDVEGRQFIEY